jgi:hypothetical protein
MSKRYEYLQELLEWTDEGSIARAVDHALPEYSIDVGGNWYYEDETEELPESVAFRLVEKAIYELHGYSSVELVINVMKILHGLKMFSWA